MKTFSSSVSPKGQITIPQEIREQLGIRPRDRVSIRLDGDEVRVSVRSTRIRDIAGTIPALEPPMDWDDIVEIAHEEHARHAGEASFA